MDTPDRRGYSHIYYSTSSSDRNCDRHHYHPYRKSDWGYFLDEFEKENTPTFDGEMKKSQDVESWFLGMNKFFRVHDYSENMKAKITTFSLKGKADI